MKSEQPHSETVHKKIPAIHLTCSRFPNKPDGYPVFAFDFHPDLPIEKQRHEIFYLLHTSYFILRAWGTPHVTPKSVPPDIFGIFEDIIEENDVDESMSSFILHLQKAAILVLGKEILDEWLPIVSGFDPFLGLPGALRDRLGKMITAMQPLAMRLAAEADRPYLVAAKEGWRPAGIALVPRRDAEASLSTIGGDHSEWLNPGERIKLIEKDGADKSEKRKIDAKLVETIPACDIAKKGKVTLVRPSAYRKALKLRKEHGDDDDLDENAQRQVEIAKAAAQKSKHRNLS
jgi:hypothetical protein